MALELQCTEACPVAGACAAPDEASAMTDPFEKATSKAPPTLGEGCLSRYDPDELTPETGTDFDGAAQLWRELHPVSDEQPGPASENAG